MTLQRHVPALRRFFAESFYVRLIISLVLRDPVDLAISMYSYICGSLHHAARPLHCLDELPSLGQFLATLRPSEQCSFLAFSLQEPFARNESERLRVFHRGEHVPRPNSGDCDAVARSIEAHVDVIGDTYREIDFFHALARAAGNRTRATRAWATLTEVKKQNAIRARRGDYIVSRSHLSRRQIDVVAWTQRFDTRLRARLFGTCKTRTLLRNASAQFECLT